VPANTATPLVGTSVGRSMASAKCNSGLVLAANHVAHPAHVRRDGTLQSIADRDLWHGACEDKTGLSKRGVCMNLLWVYVGFAVVALLLVLLLARAVGNSQRRRIRKQLGLPLDSRLSPKDALAFRAFEDTDIKLKKSFPTMSDTQRQSMAREVLRDKGVIAKRKKSVPQS